MRWLLLLGLSVLFSCGQESNNSTGASREDQHQYYTDVREVDLLDVALDVPVELLERAAKKGVCGRGKGQEKGAGV